MKLLITLEKMENLKTNALIPLECYVCSITFYSEKHTVQKVLKKSKNLALKYCSRKCMGLNRSNKITKNCCVCNESIKVRPRELKDKNYCSKKCYWQSMVKPKPFKAPRLPKTTLTCSQCPNVLKWGNKTGMCKICYLQSDTAMEQRGITFSKTRKYKTNPFTQEEFYLMSSLEEKFFDLCVVHNIEFLKPSVIKYQDGNKQRLYFPDFYLPSIDSIIEIKGYLTKEDKIKMQLVNQQRSNLNILILHKKDIETFFTENGVTGENRILDQSYLKH